MRKRRGHGSLLYRYGDQLGRIVERHRAEAALNVAKQEAEKAAELAHQSMLEAQAANRAKTEFLANMSHELRSPLNAVIGFSQVMIDQLFGPLGTQKYDTYVRDIHASGNHLLSVINDILDLAKIEAGKVELDDNEIDVRDVCDFSMSMIRERAEKRGIRTLADFPNDVPEIVGDEQKLRQMLINLLSNAVKFTLDGGEVRLVGRLLPDGRYALCVRDTGIGIKKEDLPRVLQPFTQVDGGLNRKFEGTGLGLAITKSFMELHGGTLVIESEPGVGTSASLLFPAERIVAAPNHLNGTHAHAG
ncbi:MAG: sensor histidine kinase [Alphaproteobacteria bacterium]